MLGKLSDEAHIRFARVNPNPNSDLTERALALLAEDEKQRYHRFHFAADRRSFLLAHALLRICLSQYADVAPAQWRFVRTKHGRPEIAPEQNPRDLRFSLSHAREAVACLVTRGCDCGVDIEAAERVAEPLRLAERFFAATEVATLRGLHGKQQVDHFIRLWTLKEAYVKARGLGLALPLSQYGFELGQPEALSAKPGPEFDDARGRCQFLLLRPFPDQVLAAALRGERAQQMQILAPVEEFDWRAALAPPPN